MILPAGVSAFRTPVQLPGMNYGERHFLNGFTWPYINSKGKQYDTTLTSDGWVCNCMGYNFHNKCKHIVAVHEKVIAE